jgi:hypothetical protein
MSEFKAMKFWIGDDPKCSERVQKMLFDMGYQWSSGTKKIIHTSKESLLTYEYGDLVYLDYPSEYGEEEREEINIGWLRTPKQETIELNGKNYIKADVEAALEKLKPVN